MSNAAKGLLAILGILTLTVALGAGRVGKGDATSVGTATEKAVRTAGIDVAVGSYTCRGVATGEVTAAVQWNGTTSVTAAPGGFGISLTTVVAPADALPTCAAITEGAISTAEAAGCTVSQTRFVGVTTDFVAVCTGITDDTNMAVGDLTKYIAANVRPE